MVKLIGGPFDGESVPFTMGIVLNVGRVFFTPEHPMGKEVRAFYDWVIPQDREWTVEDITEATFGCLDE